MQNEIKSIFEKSLNEGDFSSSQKNIKEKSFNRFIEQGFPNKRIEDWKFSDLNQIISTNFENLNYSKKNIDKNVDVDLINEFEHNKIIFEYGKRRPGDSEKLISNVDKLHEHINWKPKFDDLKLIIKTAVDWEKKINEKNL